MSVTMNFEEHNRRTAALWEKFQAGQAPRVPVIAGVSSRYVILDRNSNPKGITFEEYHNDPAAMLELQLELERFRRFEFDDDSQKGVPENGWTVSVDLQNVYEAAWYGAQVCFPKDNVPDTVPFLTEEQKYDFVQQPLPDPFSGIMGHARDCVEYFRRKQAEGFRYMGAPISHIEACPLWTDGPFTVACNLRGPMEFCIDMAAEPEYAGQLLDYITDATILRVKAWRRYLNLPEKLPGWGFADDLIPLLSVDMVREMLLPRYKRLLKNLCAEGTTTGIHLCGDATRFMPMLRDELNAAWFDTGFPVDFAAFSKEIGPNVVWQGGPHVSLLLKGTPAAIEAEVKRILSETMPNTRRFVLRDGNDVAPHTPMENVEAMVHAGRKYGVFPG